MRAFWKIKLYAEKYERIGSLNPTVGMASSWGRIGMREISWEIKCWLEDSRVCTMRWIGKQIRKILWGTARRGWTRRACWEKNCVGGNRSHHPLYKQFSFFIIRNDGRPIVPGHPERSLIWQPKWGLVTGQSIVEAGTEPNPCVESIGASGGLHLNIWYCKLR